MILVDTSFWVALRNRDDGRHEEAVALLRANANRRLLTTNHIRGETWTFIRRRSGHVAATGLLDFLEATPRVNVEYVDEESEAEALAWLRRHDERNYSFVDATSFVVMRRLGIAEALAFDEDFSAAGFLELRA